MYHIAACLGDGGQHKTVLINGGYDDGDDITHDDMWLLDPRSGIMEKVRYHDSSLNFSCCILLFHNLFSFEM